jgi:hypothetical protein
MVEEVVPVACWLHKGAHALLGLAMVAMAWPAVPGWLSLAALAPVGVWFLGLAAARRRPADVHHAVMAVCMAWMAAMPAMPLMPGPCHGGAGPVAGAAASYFLLAAAPFLAAPLRTGPRGPVLGPLGHGAMSLGMAVLFAAHS